MEEIDREIWMFCENQMIPIEELYKECIIVLELNMCTPACDDLVISGALWFITCCWQKGFVHISDASCMDFFGPRQRLDTWIS